MIRIKKDHEEMSQLRTSALRECRIPDVFPSNRALLLNSSYQLGTSLSGNRVCCLHQRLLDAPMEETMRHSKEGSKGRCGLSWSLQHEDPDNPLKVKVEFGGIKYTSIVVQHQLHPSPESLGNDQSALHLYGSDSDSVRNINIQENQNTKDSVKGKCGSKVNTGICSFHKPVTSQAEVWSSVYFFSGPGLVYGH
ncbi:uncharacterized protein LOC144225840 isoform X3 [Crocuta crocuta]